MTKICSIISAFDNFFYTRKEIQKYCKHYRCLSLIIALSTENVKHRNRNNIKNKIHLLFSPRKTIICRRSEVRRAQKSLHSLVSSIITVILCLLQFSVSQLTVRKRTPKATRIKHQDYTHIHRQKKRTRCTCTKTHTRIRSLDIKSSRKQSVIIVITDKAKSVSVLYITGHVAS